jgi:hypothetical protein
MGTLLRVRAGSSAVVASAAGKPARMPGHSAGGVWMKGLSCDSWSKPRKKAPWSLKVIEYSSPEPLRIDAKAWPGANSASKEK